MIEQANTEEEVLAPYYPTELHADDLDAYNELGLPEAHPHLFAQALQAQLARLPLMELDGDQELFTEHTVALSA